jgi:glycosyltransferase involved in cell wall biosynthesis
VLLVNDHPLQGGIGRYVHALDHAIRALTPPPVHLDLLLQNLPEPVDPAAWRRPADGVTAQHRPAWAKATGFGTAYLINSHHHFPAHIPAGYDLYHFSSQMMGASVRRAAPAVVTVHDLIAYRLGGNHPGVSTWLRRRHFPPLLGAQGLIFVSEYSRRDFLGQFDYPEARTSVVHHAASPVFAPRDRAESRRALGLDADRPVLLHVGSEERRKNVETLLDALAILVRHRPDLLLLRVGGPSARGRRRIARHRLEGHVRYLSGLTEQNLAAAYAAADLFVFPSVYEGFGLPVLEAMQSGCPVIAARVTSVPEITGDAAALIDPMDAEELVATVAGLLDDSGRRAGLRGAGLRRAAEFSWNLAARRTSAAYLQALGA